MTMDVLTYRLTLLSPLVLAIAWIAFGWWRVRRFALMLRREQQAGLDVQARPMKGTRRQREGLPMMAPVTRDLNYDALRDRVRAAEAELARAQDDCDSLVEQNAKLQTDLNDARRVIVALNTAHLELQGYVRLVCHGWRQGMAVEMRGN